MATRKIISLVDQVDRMAHLVGRLEDLKKARLIILGDLGLDEYFIGPVRRISPEAPVPVVEVDAQEYRVGLAANVAQNVAALGAHATLLGVTGNDPGAEKLKTLLSAQGVQEFWPILDESRPTTRKVRVMSGQHHLVRVDFERKSFLPADVEGRLLQQLTEGLLKADLLVLQDYGKGVLSESLCQKAIGLAREKQVPVFVDPHRTTPLSYYKGATLIKPNRDEAFILSGLNLDDLRTTPESLIEVGESLLEQTAARMVALTRGQEGVLLFQKGQGIVEIPTSSRQVFDVTGAGDTFLGVLATAYAAGFSIEDGAILANAASGVVVGKVGCHPCHLDELEDSLATT